MWVQNTKLSTNRKYFETFSKNEALQNKTIRKNALHLNKLKLYKKDYLKFSPKQDSYLLAVEFKER